MAPMIKNVAITHDIHPLGPYSGVGNCVFLNWYSFLINDHRHTSEPIFIFIYFIFIFFFCIYSNNIEFAKKTPSIASFKLMHQLHKIGNSRCSNNVRPDDVSRKPLRYLWSAQIVGSRNVNKHMGGGGRLSPKLCYTLYWYIECDIENWTMI